MERRHTPERRRRFAPLAIPIAIACATALAGCNQAGGRSAPAPSTQASAGVTPSGFALPSGAGCSADIARFRAVLKNDLDTGHVTQNVFTRATTDLDRGDAACAAGRDAEGRSILASTKSRFGYP